MRLGPSRKQEGPKPQRSERVQIQFAAVNKLEAEIGQDGRYTVFVPFFVF